MKSSKTVEDYLKGEKNWNRELRKLRTIIKSTELVETVKWGSPVYTVDGKNVVGIGGFKSYFGIWFFQGVFLKDKQKKLINAQEGVTKGLRQWRMNSEVDIDEELILKYVREAIQNQKDGKEIKPEKKALIIPAELELAFGRNAAIRKAFESFTPGRQREFADYVSEAKQQATREKRTGKVVPMILDGIALNDKYR